MLEVAKIAVDVLSPSHAYFVMVVTTMDTVSKILEMTDCFDASDSISSLNFHRLSQKQIANFSRATRFGVAIRKTDASQLEPRTSQINSLMGQK